MDWTGTTTLVTGASAGIGAEFARQIARRGGDVVVTARREDRLTALAHELETGAGVTAHVLAADLAAPAGPADLVARLGTAGIRIDQLINNAGFATHGRFVDEDADRIAAELAVDVTAVVALTRALLPGMLERRRGAVVHLASTAAFQPVPQMAVYAASKAFVLSFSEALWAETRGSGVRVLALAPGATSTEFFEIAGEAASIGRRQSVEQVVSTAMAALDGRSRPTVISGRMNAITAISNRLIPRSVATRVAGRLVAPKA